MKISLPLLFVIVIFMTSLTFAQPPGSVKNNAKNHIGRYQKGRITSNANINSIDTIGIRQQNALIQDQKVIKLLNDENNYLRKSIDDNKATVDYTKYIAIIISIIALVGSILQYNNAKMALRANVTVNLLSEFRNEKWDEVRTIISSKKEAATFEEIKHYSQLINHFGYLLERKYVSSDALFDMMGTGVIKFWTFYKEQILEQRTARDNEFYQYHVEYFHARMKSIELKRTKHIKSLLEKSRLP